MSRRIARKYVISGLLLLGLSGCSSSKDTTGFGQPSRDAFLVITSPSLSYPPDYTLRAPAQKGKASPLVKSHPARRAQKILGVTPPTKTRPLSEGEKLLLKDVRSLPSDSTIRTFIRHENAELGQKGPVSMPSYFFFGRSHFEHPPIINPTQELNVLNASRRS